MFLVVAIVLLLGFSWTGISGGISQLTSARTSGQTAQTVLQLIHGLCALLSVLTTFWAERWNRVMLVCWTIATALTAGLAAVVWGGSSLRVGLASGVAAGLIAAGIGWLLRAGAGASVATA